MKTDDVEMQPLALAAEDGDDGGDGGGRVQAVAEPEKDAPADGADEDMQSEENLRLAKTAMRKISWRILPLLGLAVSIAHVEKVNIALAAEGIMRDLQLSTAQFGLATSLYFIPYAVFQVPVVLFIKRFGIR